MESISAMRRVGAVGFFTCIMLASLSHAAETNGVSPQSISLPSGPGSIEGLGESFEPQLNTGTASYAVGFQVPPGRVGHQPQVGIAYNGGQGNGVVGIGWSLSGTPSVQRQSDKGLPRYDATDTFVTSSGEELVLLSDGSYRAENEGGFRRYSFDSIANTWTVETPGGGNLTFGDDASARVEDGGRTFRWMLTSAEDSNGNLIEYSYTSLPGSTNQVFCDRIYYTRHVSQSSSGEHVVVFSYAGNRPDPISDYRSGFEVTTQHRLVEVNLCTHGGSFSAESLCDDVGEVGAARIRAYRLRYDEAGACSGLSCQSGLVGAFCTADEQCVAGATRLAGVEQVGADDVSTLPELTFAYTDYDFSSPSWTGLSGFPSDALAGNDATFVDLNADGLPDILETTAPGSYELRENRGPIINGIISFAAPVVVSGPAGQQLSSPGTQVADFDGDGVADLVTRPAPGDDDFQIYSGTGRGAFSQAARIFKMSGFDGFVGAEGFASEDLRLVDVDFDKRIDVVRTVKGPSGLADDLLVRRTTTVAGQDTLLASQSCGALSGALFQDGKTFLVDMNGDRLLDLVVVDLTAGENAIQGIRYYPAVGHGGFGRSGACGAHGQSILLAGDVVNPTGADFASFREFRWEDVTNDGLADLIWLGPSNVSAWINRGGAVLEKVDLGVYPSGSTLDLCEVSPSCPMPDIVKLVDVNANGTTDIVFVDRTGSPVARYLDLAGASGVPAHLLREIRNGLGRITTIGYEPSTVDYLEADGAGAPWKSRLPFPVTVVSEKRVRFGLDLDGTPGEDEYLTEFRYRDGFYDGFEREFRGFSEVEVIARGDASQPTLVTRHSFHTGAPDGVDNDGDGATDERTARGGAEEESLKGVPLETRQETCSNGPDGDCLVTGEVFSQNYSRWEVRTLYGATGRACSLDAEVACCGDSECGPAGLGTCEVVDAAETGILPEAACEVGKSVHWAVATGERTAVIERGSGPRVDLMSEMDFDSYGNETLSRSWGVVDAPDLPPFGCVLTSGVCSGNSEILCGTDSDCGVQGPCVRTSHADAAACVGDPFLFTNAVAPVDERFERTEFIQDQVNWLIDRPKTKEVTSVAPTDLVSRDRFYYDGAAYIGLSLGAVDRGNLTRQESFVENDAQAEDVYIESIRNEYDGFGNIIGTLDPLGNTAGAPHSRLVAFDPSFQTYPVSETVFPGGCVAADGLDAFADYHEGFGVVRESIDFNGNPTDFGHDFFARLTSIVRPGDSVGLPTSVFVYRLADAQTGELYEYDTAGNLTKSQGSPTVSSVTTHRREMEGQAGTYDEVDYVDGLGRPLAKAKEGETGFIVSEAVRFNRRGATSARLQPYDSGSDAFATIPGGDRFVLGYDALGRVTDVRNPADAFGSFSNISTAYSPLTRTALDELDNEMTYVEDGLNRLSEVQEVNRGDRYITQYRYNAAGSLERTIDARNNTTLFAYDGLQRRLSIDHPDRGRLRYEYDAASNVSAKVDAKNQRIEFDYDGANRLIAEDYLDEVEPFSFHRDPDVAIHYDCPQGAIDMGDGSQDVATQTLGRLAWVDDLAGEEHASYDARGRARWQVKRVRDPGTGVETSYKNEMSFDALDRAESIVYPDNDRVSYEYNPQGLVEKVHGGFSADIISNIDYRPSEQLDLIRYGNGVTTDYEYDPRLRLTDLRSEMTGDPAHPLIDYSYVHDLASNITRIEDLRPASLIPDDDGRRNTQILDYDDLYRLERVQYSFAPPGEPDRMDGVIDYSYDELGNMTTKSSSIVHFEDGLSVTDLGTMSYGGSLGSIDRVGRGPGDPPGPHALTSADNGSNASSYPYDDNGNMTSVDGAELTWDFKDRLVDVRRGNTTARYVYDHSDRRILKIITPDTMASIQNQEVTTYPSRYFEIRYPKEPVKYVFRGDTRVAQVTGTLDPTRERVQRFWLSSGWNLLALTVQASDATAQLGVGSDPRIVEAFAWKPESRGFEALTGGTGLPSGSVVWIRASEPAALQVMGIYSEPTTAPIASGGSFVPVPGLQALALQQVLPSETTDAWVFDAENQVWRPYLGDVLASLSNAPDAVGPGDVIYVQTAAASQLGLAPAVSKVRYYHQDHLGSSNVVADGNGALGEEVTFYPFGHPRMSYRSPAAPAPVQEPYQFTQKELDVETGLQYFIARYYDGRLGRFVSVDPLYAENPTPNATKDDPYRDFRNSQKLNLYSYTHNNPVNKVDPDGLEVAEAAINADGTLMGVHLGVSVAFVLDDNWDFDIQLSSRTGVQSERWGASLTSTVAVTSAETTADTQGVQTYETVSVEPAPMRVVSLTAVQGEDYAGAGGGVGIGLSSSKVSAGGGIERSFNIGYAIKHGLLGIPFDARPMPHIPETSGDEGPKRTSFSTTGHEEPAYSP